jgi:hypothetical protein
MTAPGTAAASEGIGVKILLMIIDKLLLGVVAALAIAVLQNRLEVAQERLEKARKLNDINVDRPLAIAVNLPGHLDQYITYMNHVRAVEVKATAERLTELQGNIDADIVGCLAFFTNKQLGALGKSIRDTVKRTKAAALTSPLGTDDIASLEKARHLGYMFHACIVNLSVRRVEDQVNAAHDHAPPASPAPSPTSESCAPDGGPP